MNHKHSSTPIKRSLSDVYAAFPSIPNASLNHLPSLSAKRLSVIAERSRLLGSPIESLAVLPNSTNQLSQSSTDPSVIYVDDGDCVEVCEYCNARFWYAERLKSSSSLHRPKYNQCCKSGRVRLHHPKDPPDRLKHLLENSDFRDNIRVYNSMFAMTSFGATLDNSINIGSAPYVFKVTGQICHRIGSFCPPSDKPPKFLQMYIYDTDHEILNRISVFGENASSCLNVDVVRLLIDMFDEHNDLVKLFRTARDLCLSSDVPNFSICLHSSVGERNYDLPAPGVIGAIVFEDQPNSSTFDIVIHKKGDTPKRVSKLHPLYMALQYPLLFVYGEQGWNPKLRLADDGTRCRQLTMNMFYSYQIHDRLHSYTLLLMAGRLFQQYLVDAYLCIEQNRLDYILTHQNDFRSEYLQGVHDALLRGDTTGHDIGKRTVLPSSFTGGPRYMYKHYQDALAICRVYGNPQYFITFTCNVKWPEITRHLAATPSVKAQDRPDIIARVFKIKVDAFMRYLRSGIPFGEVAADLYTIEFQKRGLPHCHTLLWVTPFKIQTPKEVDNYICAEIPDPTLQPELHKVVTEFMIHGPCGLPKPNAPCMVNNICSKRFPKTYEMSTRFDKDGYVHYKRKIHGFSVIRNGVTMDDASVVPYNKSLLLRFNAHINVEYCGWSMVIKYLFKYISKGANRLRFTITRTNITQAEAESSSRHSINEVQNFVDGRFICPHEATWRIFDFPIHCRNPPVQLLAVHLENMQNVTFKDSDKLKNVINSPFVRQTTLTAWLHTNTSDERGRHLRYVDFVSEYRWNPSAKCWLYRTYNKTPTIGRLIYIHPSCGEAFYLRMMLGHQRGCQTFADIRTVDGEILPTYRAACEKLGLLENDNEWVNAFTEASTWATSKELRSLFTHMLLYCEISNPSAMWQQHWRLMSDDIPISVEQNLGFRPSNISEADLQQHILFELEMLLNSNTNPSSLCKHDLPMPRPELLSLLTNRLLMEEKNYDTQKLAAEHEVLKNALNQQQLSIYQSVINSSAENKQILLFVYGHGGTGKTFLWTTIINALRASNKIVLAVAASGIASLLLPSGRTAHSRFKIPLDLTDDSICYVKKNTQLAQLLIETSLIIWDEAPMSDRRCFESLDKTLRDILDSPTVPFGGKSIILGGDFRQTLPIKPKASKIKIINSSLPRSHLWSHFSLRKLTENMRLKRPNLTHKDKEDLTWFSSWLLDLGDGKLGEPLTVDEPDARLITIPTQFFLPQDSQNLSAFIAYIYDEETLKNPTIEKFSDKVIVCPKNKTADEINSVVLAMSKEPSTTYPSFDSILSHTNDPGDTELLYPIEYLNSLNFNGMPPHALTLKVNTPIILLRNINQTAGLCNGTRLLTTRLLPKVIEARIITGVATGHRVYIPRITFVHNQQDMPFTFKRKQFPIKLCYAMTINKSQGQSLNKIGVYLPEPVFSHGQLYVAFSRATSVESLKVLTIPQQDTPPTKTKNIVFSSFLKDLHHYKMASRTISAVKPNDNADPIDVRVIRTWNFIGYKNECNFLFVDKMGDAITAVADARDKKLYDSKLKLQSCYRISRYVTTKARKTSNVVTHSTIIQLGRGTIFEPIDDIGFPVHYFDFIPYDKLNERRSDNTYLSDFIGRLDTVISDIRTKSNKRLLKLHIEDTSERIVEIALWEEIANTVDKKQLINAPFPTVIAVTAMKTDWYDKHYQLQSSTATHIYINPEIQETANIISEFTAKYNSATIHLRRAITLAELLTYNPIENSNTRFTSVASITSFNNNRGWFYKGCAVCNARLSQIGDQWTCKHHPNQIQPKLLFCVTATISDATESATVTLFDEAVSTLLDIECDDLVTHKGFDDPFTIPVPLNATKGRSKIFILQMNGYPQPNKSRFVSNQVFNISPTTAEEPPQAKESASTTIEPATPAPKATRKRNPTEPLDKPDEQDKRLKSIMP